MVRAGLLVPAGVLAAAEQLADRFAVRAENRWGMSPFAAPVQAAFAAAYAIPEVHRLVVGTNRPVHLDQLVAASRLPLDQEAINGYRRHLTETSARARVAAS